MSGYRKNREIKSRARFRGSVIKESPPVDIDPLLTDISTIEGSLVTINSTLVDLDDRVTGLEP